MFLLYALNSFLSSVRPLNIDGYIFARYKVGCFRNASSYFERGPMMDHIIDCDADPIISNEFRIEEHQSGGLLLWDPAKFVLYLSKEQQRGYITGNNLRNELRCKPVLNANVLDYLLIHPDCIPEDWKKDANGYTRYICFWGTIYRHILDGRLYVRNLYLGEDGWHSDYRLLGGYWGYNAPAVAARRLGFIAKLKSLV